MYASLLAQLVKNLPAIWETWVRSLVWEDPLEKGKATHSSILAWKIPWTVYSTGSQRVRQDGATFTFTSLCIKGHTVHHNGEGNGTPLQYSCLENPMDGGARWARVHGVVKSRT